MSDHITVDWSGIDCADLKAKIWQYVNEKWDSGLPSATVDELVEQFPEIEGPYCWKGAPGLVFWNSMSLEGQKAFREAVDEDLIELTSECGDPILAMASYTRMPELPFAKSPREHKKPHWYPLFFKSGNNYVEDIL
ncbi:MAG: hypothetical protein ACR2RE_11740 [Geminicoccaceae bacterium]